MERYAFTNPVLAGKVDAWKSYVKEMTGPRANELKRSRKKAGLSVERVWLQKTPMGDFAVVYRARDRELGREVAVKQIHQQFLADPRQLNRLRPHARREHEPEEEQWDADERR